MKFSSTVTIVAIVVLTACSVGAVVYRVSKSEQILTAVELFEQGQYYFNHDDDPAGPYNRELALEYYFAAYEKNPEVDIALRYQIGRIHFLDGDFLSALRMFQEQIDVHGDALPQVYYMIGLTHGFNARETGILTEWQKAEVAFETFLLHAPRSPWARVDLSWIYFVQGKYRQMIPLLAEAIIYDPHNPWVLNMYGLALLNTGSIDQAIERFDQAGAHALQLTPVAWGRAYPGNDPADWGRGLSEFRDGIARNREIAQNRMLANQDLYTH